MTIPDKCLVVRLTPPGQSAIATILLTGAEALPRIEPFVRGEGNDPLTLDRLRGMVLARWQHTPDAQEEVVLHWEPELGLEIHCHGGSASVNGILKGLQQVGCHILSCQDWLARQGWSTPKAEAAQRLCATCTETTALLLLDQYHGALDRELLSVEAALAKGACGDEVSNRIEALLATWRYGGHLTEPFRIVFAGKPNVGKSSLVNRLLGYSRSLVFDEPGTTRDAIRGLTALDGWPVELVDTAGWRQDASPVEAAGIALGLAAWAQADLRVLVYDASTGRETADGSYPSGPSQDIPLPPQFVVANKCDLVPREDDGCRACRVSALTGEGIATLAEALARELVPVPLHRSVPMVFTRRQQQALIRARHALRHQNIAETLNALRAVRQGAADVFGELGSEPGGLPPEATCHAG